MKAEGRGGLVIAAPRRWIAAGVAVAVLLGAGAVVVGRQLLAPARSGPATSAPAAPAAGELVRFDDEARGISISRPAAWRSIPSSDPAVRFLAEGDGSSMLVRTVDLETPVGPGQLGEAKQLTDRLVRAGQRQPLRPARRVSLGGLAGYLYLYTFPDAASGQQAAHAHYFLFRGRTLITLVFQTVPAQRLPQIAPLFDRIGETLRVAPGLSGGAGTP